MGNPAPVSNLLPAPNGGRFYELAKPPPTSDSDHNYYAVTLTDPPHNAYYPTEVHVSGTMQTIDLYPATSPQYSGYMQNQNPGSGPVNAGITDLPTVWLGSLADPAQG